MGGSFLWEEEAVVLKRSDIYNKRCFKVWNFQYTDDPFEMIVGAYAVLLGEGYAWWRKRAALAILKILLQKEFLNCILTDDVAPFSRDDPRVVAWAKKIKAVGKCEICGCTTHLEAHHLIPWADYPKGRLDLKNGKCLCAACHAEQHRGERAERLILSKRKKR